MSLEMALISRIAATGQMQTVLEYGITVDDFLGEVARAYWKLLHGYYMHPSTAGSVLTREILEQYLGPVAANISAYDVPTMTLEALCHEVRKARLIVEAKKASIRLAEDVSSDPASAIAAQISTLQNLMALGVKGNTDISLDRSLERTLEKIRLMQEGVDFSILRWPWQALDEATLGIQRDDYIVFYGRPKSMKSWVLSYLVAWSFMQGKKILLYTKEMTPDNIFARACAAICQMPYDDLRRATLSQAQVEQLQSLRRIHADPGYPGKVMCLSGKDAPPGGDTVPWIHSKIDKYKPDLVFIDGFYLLSSTSGSRNQRDDARVMGISRELRAMNLHTQVPIVATIQANRKAAQHSQANLDEVAFSDAVSQDATMLTRVIADKTQPTISLVIGGSREFKLHGIRINAVPAIDFSFHSVLTEKDIEKAKEQDTADADPNSKPKRNGASPRVDRAQASMVDQQLADMQRSGL